MNVATERRTSLLDLIGTLEELLGVSAEVTHAGPRTGDIRHSAAACDRLRAWHGASGTTTLRDGLAATLAWMRSEGAEAR